MTLLVDDGVMAQAHRPDPFPTGSPDELPRHVRVLLAQYGRAVAALRVYRRRGWNETAVLASVQDKRKRVDNALAALEHGEKNPRLF